MNNIVFRYLVVTVAIDYLFLRGLCLMQDNSGKSFKVKNFEKY